MKDKKLEKPCTEEQKEQKSAQAVELSDESLEDVAGGLYYIVPTGTPDAIIK